MGGLTRAERRRRGLYRRQWPPSLLDLVESEDLAPAQASMMMAYCEEQGRDYPGDHDGWLHLYAEMWHRCLIW